MLKFFDKSKVIDFTESRLHLTLEAGTQPFIGDLNGDFLEDILFTDVNHNMMVAFQKRNPEELILKDFNSALLVLDETEGCL